MRVLRFLFNTVRGFLTMLAVVVVLGAAAIAVFLVIGPPDGGSHEAMPLPPKGEIDPVLNIDLDPMAGSEIGLVYQAWLSPHQEAEEESDVPPGSPEQFLSTEPSVERELRPSRGHGIVAFNREMSRAYVQLELANIDPEDIVLAHIHCGKPGQLGPIMVDIGATGDLAEYFADNSLNYEITNADIAAATHGHGIVGAATAGCPILRSVPFDRHRTIAGMATIAAEGELYFNIHTKQQTFFGDIRGQLQPMSADELAAAELNG